MMRTVLISGASTGIGRESALRLASGGHKVLAGVRNQNAADDLSSLSEGRVEPVFLDISDPGSVEKFCSEFEKRFETDGLYGVYNNAGIAVSGPLEYLPMDEWRRQFEVNFFGHIDLTRRLLKFVRTAKGRILFTSSIGGKVAMPLLGPYCASKFAIEGLADSLRMEMQPFGVSVSVIEPGSTKTPMLDATEEVANRAMQYIDGDGGDTYRAIGEKILAAFNRFRDEATEPSRVADAVVDALFSPKPRARYLVGKDARLQSVMKALLSDRAMDGLKRKLLKL